MSDSYADGLHRYVKYVRALERQIDRLYDGPKERERAIKKLVALRNAEAERQNAPASV